MSAPRTVELLRDLDRPTGWVLLVDGVEQSYVDVVDPTHLEFEYMQHMAIRWVRSMASGWWLPTRATASRAQRPSPST
jgi:hypothetical protein